MDQQTAVASLPTFTVSVWKLRELVSRKEVEELWSSLCGRMVRGPVPGRVTTPSFNFLHSGNAIPLMRPRLEL